MARLSAANRFVRLFDRIEIRKYDRRPHTGDGVFAALDREPERSIRQDRKVCAAAVCSTFTVVRTRL